MVETTPEKATTKDEIIEKLDSPKLSAENVGEFYNEIDPDGYDEFVKAIKYTEPEHLVKLIGNGCVVDIDPASEILDVAAGTGHIGILLKEKGFTNIMGVDASDNLLVKLMQTGAYKDSRCVFLGLGLDKWPEDLKNRFDMVTASGCFMSGHIPNAGFDDIHASLKTGGFFVASMRSTYWTDGKFKDKTEEMTASGQFKMVHTTTYLRDEWRPKNDEKDQKIESTLLVLQKLN